MSEFKYACPVCGQHIKCDSTQSGSVMECPTCLQKIIAPQAPASEDQKFILSGKKLGDAPKTPTFSGALPPPPARRTFPVAGVALVLLIVGTAVAFIFFRGKVFPFGSQSASAPPVSSAASPQASAPVPAAPPADIPHANDTNWLLSLEAVDFPDTPASGRIHGVDFLCERAYLQSGTLTLRQGTKFQRCPPRNPGWQNYQCHHQCPDCRACDVALARGRSGRERQF